MDPVEPIYDDGAYFVSLVVEMPMRVLLRPVLTATKQTYRLDIMMHNLDGSKLNTELRNC